MRREKLKATSELVISLKDVSKSFGSSILFEGVSFDLVRGSRTALVGDNGSGKTTLIKIIAGLADADEGTLAVSSGAVISYLPQNVSVFADEKAQYTIREFLAEPIPDLYEIAVKQSKLESNLATCEDTSVKAKLKADLEDLEYEFSIKGGWRVYEVMAELKLGVYKLGAKIKELSGGEKTQLALAKAFLAEPDVLLLDEPTNSLDIDARVWLDAKLEKFSGAVLIITHDRYLLNRIVAQMLEIDANSKSVIRFRGNYQAYLQRKKADYERKLASYKSEDIQLGLLSQKKEKANIAINHYSKRTDSSKLNYDLKGERVQQGRAKTVRKVIRDMETLEVNRTVVPRKPVSVTFAFDANSRSSEQFALTFNKIAKSYDTVDKQILKNCSASISFGESLAIIGPNGAGKSTLLKILAGKLQPDAGEVRFGNEVVVGYLDQEFESFDRTQTVADWVKQYTIDPTKAFEKLTQVGLNVRDVLPKQIMQLSYGQQRKLQLLDLIIRGCNVLLLDEPTNHMDLHSLEEFESVIAEFPGAVIAITHDQYFIKNVASKVLRLENGELHMDAHNIIVSSIQSLISQAVQNQDNENLNYIFQDIKTAQQFINQLIEWQICNHLKQPVYHSSSMENPDAGYVVALNKDEANKLQQQINLTNLPEQKMKKDNGHDGSDTELEATLHDNIHEGSSSLRSPASNKKTGAVLTVSVANRTRSPLYSNQINNIESVKNEITSLLKSVREHLEICRNLEEFYITDLITELLTSAEQYLISGDDLSELNEHLKTLKTCETVLNDNLKNHSQKTLKDLSGSNF